ncbi:TonB-dependent receptor plug domain-containing protein [Hydrogenimonas sp.]
MPLRLLSIASLLFTLLFGEVSDRNRDDASVHAELLGALDEAATIAAEHRLNVDDIPEFVTVWHRQELRALGIKDLFEALSLVPGIQTSIMQNGIKKVVMRGFNNPDNITFDRFKLIIDGHIVQTAIFQNTSYYLNYPVELIERIEVILGPAAALQTSGALTGIIKVTTRNSEGNEGALFARAGSYEEVMGGFCKTYAIGENRSLGLDLYYRRHDRSLEASEYILEGTSPQISKDSEWLRDYSIGAVYKEDKFQLSARTKMERHGNYYGWEEHLEMTDEPSMQNRYFYLQGRYENGISDKESIRLQLDYNHYKFDSTAQDYIDTQAGKVPYDFALYLSEESWQFDASLTSVRFQNHTLKGGWYGSRTRQIGDRFDITAPGGLTNRTKLIQSGLSRNLSSLYLNDMAALTKSTDIHLGIRYDYLSDMKKGYLSANASLLWRLREELTLKIGYGHAFRAPSWVELYTYPNPGMRVGDPNLEAEEADTIEGSVIYKPSLNSRLHINLYRSRIKNLLDIFESPRTAPDAPGYANLPSRFSNGFELEYRLKPAPGHALGLSCSYNDTDYITEDGIHQAMPGVAHWNGYAYYIFSLNASSGFSAYLRYMGPRTANEDTNREDVPSYTTVDITYSFALVRGWRFFANVKNLFDEEVADLSYHGRHDGIKRAGRTWFLSFEYPL